MNEAAKKKNLRMIPHALYVLTCHHGDRMVASTVSWVSQASFQPPLVAVGLKVDSQTFQLVQTAQGFVLNFLGADQKDVAQKFFKHAEQEGNKLAGETFQESSVLKHPVFPHMAGHLECKVLEIVGRGDHAVVVAEVLEAAEGTAAGPLLLSSTGWQYGG
jgi:flavin reductase (DIM6/NTAB) family NADH-FMN oxidoreductase RutF